MKKSTIVTVLIIILIGIMITDFNFAGSNVFELFFRRLETNSFNENTVSFNADTNTSHKYSIDKELMIERDGRNKFILNNNLGSIKINGEERDNIDIKATITVYSDKQNLAESYAKKLEITSMKNNNSIEVKVPVENKPEDVKGVKVDYIINAPKSMFLQLNNKFGLLEVSNFNNGANLSNRYQESIIRNIGGEEITITNKFGNLKLSEVTQGKEMEVITAYNKTTIENIERDMQVNASYGDTSFYNIKGLILDAKYTNVEIDKINGKLNSDIEFGNIVVNAIKYDTKIDGKYADVSVELDGELENYEIDGETRYGDIRTNVGGSINKEDNKKELNYQKGNGEKKIILNTSYADLNIQQK